MTTSLRITKMGISYWSVYRQVRIDDARQIPDDELAAMPERDRRRALRWLDIHAED